MIQSSALIDEARARYDAYQLEALPRALQRNSLDYYYLSVYPSLSEMRPFDAGDEPPHPPFVGNAYVHIPFCSGVCDFCSYYVMALSPRRRVLIAHYLELLKAEFDYHARHSVLDISYLYFGGGTPSLIPTDALAGFLSYLAERCYLNPSVMGTLELHPEFFNDEGEAGLFLDILKHHGIGRVSVGYQVSDEDILRDTNRRHATDFMSRAMTFLRDRDFLVNIDLMYGLPGQSQVSWATTLATAIAFRPDSISTYFLFVDRGTGLYERVRRSLVELPPYQKIQTMHLMAQIALEAAGYHELPNDFWARNVGDPAQFQPERLPSSAVTLPVGPGAYGYYGQTQLANVFDLDEYKRRKASGRSPLWRGYKLNDEEAYHRDVMFSLKNEPYIDCALFRSAYNRSPLEDFAGIFAHLIEYDLVKIDTHIIQLTAKGRLCVEEIACLFRHPAISPAADSKSESRFLAKHNYSPTYPVISW